MQQEMGMKSEFCSKESQSSFGIIKYFGESQRDSFQNKRKQSAAILRGAKFPLSIGLI